MRTHWRLRVACCLGAVIVGWWLTPPGSGQDGTAWSSTPTVVPAPGPEDAVKLDVVRTFAMSEQVAADAAKQLKVVDRDEVPALKVRGGIFADSEAGMLTITAEASGQPPEQAGRVGELPARTSVPVAGIALTASPGSPCGTAWPARRPYEGPASGGVTALPSRYSPELPPDRRAPTWARGREGAAPCAEGDDL